jgi:transporter family-2 protein
VPAQPLAIALALLAGIAGGAQIAINGTFGRRIGFLEAACFASILTVLILVSATLLARGSLGGVTAGLHLPPWLWLGGLGSAILVLSVTFASPRIGALATGGLLIAGQLCILLCVDTFGWFGLDRVAPSVHRAIGLVLLAAGAVLILRR